ncbi:pro-FMRFamide-related neuropeptide FF [Aquila chrysaetos chrysaetos]|uniref:pro-FMRFamide-related neuropeptide FF n=1 Tax=Aquila chrysaetos chrysaetos TaxID=223781 RepID=UPI001176F44D|nr:pro-FMRFamide-related neuropeptide FF [Aquila chrysaetos chrysaetos]
MAGRLLLLVLLLAGTLRAARCCPGPPDPGTDPDLDLGPGPDPRPTPPQVAAAAAPPGPPPPAAAALGALLRSLQRPDRSPGSLLQPQRFGRGLQGGSQARLSPRSWDPPAAPFWTMATPQRFGRRR